MTELQKKATPVVGTVVSTKMEKTVVVRIDRTVKHKVGKYIRLSTKLHVHDAESECNVGDKVEIVSVRPISKLKCWKLHKIITKAV